MIIGDENPQKGQAIEGRRFMLELAYDGGHFSGWQSQPAQSGVRTVQSELERAIAKTTGETVSVVASGRTDAGVHALYQVAAVTTGTRLAPDDFGRAVNAALPRSIRIWRVREVPGSFHPIADVCRKRYRYLLSDARPFPPFWAPYVWHVLKPVELDAMREAAQFLRGTHDFAALQTVGSPRKTTVRTVFDVVVGQQTGNFPWLHSDEITMETPFSGPVLTYIEIEADGFLYNMVRAAAGTLVALGQRRRGFETPSRMRDILESRDRALAGPTAPPHGLFMVRVVYDTAAVGGPISNLFPSSSNGEA